MNEPLGIFLSEEEIVIDMLLYRLVEKEKVTLRGYSVKEIKELCVEIGASVAKHYRLGDENNPYVDHTTTKAIKILSGVNADHNSPINISHRIVLKIWARLTGNPIPLLEEPTLEISDYSDEG